ncbi:MAG TPA: DivIVA domain-containing protein, partial [Acidimicrobiales bacterium]|nr:DivIVA domain-containing protein [Acidimicrobiales bacterium]
MDLTPQALHAVEFREARRNGYNTRDVDDFIERVAAGAGQLQDRLQEAEARAEEAEAQVADLRRQVDELHRRPPAAEASETDETLRRTLVLAQRTADATIKEAKEEANRVLSEAREEAARTRAEAEAEARRGAEAARVNVHAEIDSLLVARDRLKVDLESLGRRIDDQRAQLRAGLEEMQRLLDDPHALKPLPPVALSEVARPGPLPPELVARDPAGNGRQPAGGEATVEHVPARREPGGGPVLGPPPTRPLPFAMAAEGDRPWSPAELQPPGDE